MKFHVIFILLISAALLFGCTAASLNDNNSDTNLNGDNSSDENYSPVFNDLNNEDYSSSDLSDLNELIAGQNEFAFKLYNIVKDDSAGENVFFSPYSISTAFSMVYEGAKGDTASEMQNTLNLLNDENLRCTSNSKLYSYLNRSGKNYSLSTANALWVQKDYLFLEDYLSTVKSYYHSSAELVDFINNGPQAVNKINDWASANTNQKIPQVLDPSMDTRELKLVLTNAVYFKGEWENIFETQFNYPFTKLDGEKVDSNFMGIRRNDFNYFQSSDYQAVEIPYKNKELSMIVFLPKENKESSIQMAEAYLLIKNMVPSRVDITMPKFEYKTHYELDKYLKKMGINFVFAPGNADLSGIDGTRNLYIGFALHDAFVNVSETGTEAAAVTTIGIKATGMPVQEEPPIDFTIDHPFTFIIRDNNTSAILFMGSVQNPTQN